MRKEFFTKTSRYPIIDIHAHLLPGVDDGAQTFEEVSQMIQLASKEGIVAAIITPHYSSTRGKKGLLEQYEQLEKKVKSKFPDFNLYLGHETYYHADLIAALENGNAFTMADSRYVLIEFKPESSYSMIKQALQGLIFSGYIPILAHVERYTCLKNPSKLESLRKDGCFMQMNYDSLHGYFWQNEIKRCRRLVKEGKIDFLATDMHRLSNRAPKISRVLKWLYTHVDDRLIKDMTYNNAMCVINNEIIS